VKAIIISNIINSTSICLHSITLSTLHPQLRIQIKNSLQKIMPMINTKTLLRKLKLAVPLEKISEALLAVQKAMTSEELIITSPKKETISNSTC
jgi:hypothetical protein